MDLDHVDRMMQAWQQRAPDVDVTPLEVAGRLLRCATYLQRAIDEALRSLGLSFGDFDVLNTLRRRNDPDGTNPRLLASSALITSGSMTSRLDRLERARLITRHPDPSDRRAIRVHLTQEGEALAERALHAVLDADQRFLEPLNPPERGTVAASLKQLLLRHDPF
jgi:DNA-binding MarR family transcriptional regulator